MPGQRLPAGRSVQEVIDAVAGGERLVPEQHVPAAVTTFHDTFDWRLSDAGLRLTSSGSGRSRDMTLQRHDGRPVVTARERKAAAFADEFADAALAKRVGKESGVRRLLPVLEVQAETLNFAILDSRDKTVARLALQPTSVRIASLDWQPLGTLVAVRPLKGFAKAAARVQARLDGAELGLVESGDLLSAGLAVFDRAPGDYSSSFRVPLQPDLPANEAARVILATLARTIAKNVDGTCQDLDIEFLHDLRVAIRRSRALLSQFRDILPGDVLQFGAELKWLGTATGPVRDLDVYLYGMDDYRAMLPGGHGEWLDPLEDWLRQSRRRELRRLRGALTSERFARFQADWGRQLADPWFTDEDPAVIDVAVTKLGRLNRKLLKRGGRIGDTTPAQKLHDLRLDAKKYRYLLEFFRSLFPASTIDHAIGEFKKVQDILGDFNDCHVQQEALLSMAEDMKDVPRHTLLAMGSLTAVLSHRQDDLRRRFFSGRFRRFEAAQDEFDRLYGR